MNTTKLRLFTLFILLGGLFGVAPLSVAAQSYTVTLGSFRVNQQTNEGLRASDGADDEVKFISHVGTLDAAGAYSYGTRAEIPIMRGIRTGTTDTRITPASVLFNGEIGGNTRAVVIIPTIWEWDDLSNLDPTLPANYENSIRTSQNSVRAELASIVRNRPVSELSKFLLSGSVLGINTNEMKLAGGIPQDRPIGMHTTAINQFGFMPQGLVLTGESAEFISRTRFGYEVGVVPVQYVDAAGMGGNYIIFLKVERENPCPGLTDFTSTFSGTAEMTTSNKYAPGPFFRPVNMTVAFTQCRTQFQITGFDPIVTDPFDIRTPGGSTIQNRTTVTKIGGGDGRFDAGIGRVETPLTLHFRHSAKQDLGIFAAPSDLSVNLTTQGNGSKKDPTSGEVVLVGSGQFSGGFLGGSTGNITVTGSFSPHPRP